MGVSQNGEYAVQEKPTGTPLFLGDHCFENHPCGYVIAFDHVGVKFGVQSFFCLERKVVCCLTKTKRPRVDLCFGFISILLYKPFMLFPCTWVAVFPHSEVKKKSQGEPGVAKSPRRRMGALRIAKQ